MFKELSYETDENGQAPRFEPYANIYVFDQKIDAFAWICGQKKQENQGGRHKQSHKIFTIPISGLFNLESFQFVLQIWEVP